MQLLIVLHAAPLPAPTPADAGRCSDDLVQAGPPALAVPGRTTESLLNWIKKKAVDKTLDVMAAWKGLPKYLKRNEELKTSKLYLAYRNFGEMGLAELGISVRYNKSSLDSLNTGRPLIIVANHHLGIADGLALQYMAGVSRPAPTLLLLARWIEKLMPHAVYGDELHWGTAVPVDINKPKAGDPQYDTKMTALKAFNSFWTRTSTRVLKAGGALIIFPAGHVASIEAPGTYPESVVDAPGSWTDGFLNLARLGKADIVFAQVDSVNSEAFYRDRKRFGGGDKERVIWFFSEAVAKRDKTIDIFLSKPMSLEEVYNTLSREYGVNKEALAADPGLTGELMRKFTYGLSASASHKLDTKDSPPKVPAAGNAR